MPASAPAPAELELFTHDGLFYQKLGEVWCHSAKEFMVLYAPLYTCEAAAGRFEAHRLAVTAFARWQTKFTRVSAASLPSAAAARIQPPLPVNAQHWPHAAGTRALPSAAASRSGLGRRSHQPVLLEHILGDYRAFLDVLLLQLRAAGLDPVARGYECDHVCYRCSTDAEYRQVCDALVPEFGSLLVEGMIGGRPISTIKLHDPLLHAGCRVSCVEIPAVKAGSPYESGLEHAEFVVGIAEDGFVGTEALQRFVRSCEEGGVTLPLRLPAEGEGKECNAVVGASWRVVWGDSLAARKVSVRFHARPLDQVVDYEIAHGLAEPPPEGYWERLSPDV
jgi:predicted metalloenzyme YecM